MLGKMIDYRHQLDGRIALITGAAARIGATTARFLHAAGCDVILHYRNSGDRAHKLAQMLNEERARSAFTLQGDLADMQRIEPLAEEAVALRGHLDILINNASSYYPTPVGSITQDQWDDLFASNARAPLFLSQALAPTLTQSRGCIVNLVDIHADRPNAGHPVYSMAKAANAMMVKALARDLAPEVRVNGIAPGAALWPEHFFDDADRQEILKRTPLGRPAGAEQIAQAVLFMVAGTDYVTGQILAVDGGRSVQQ
jgi:pteridine reductase